jgi:alcohol dehydrogenase class IV
MTRHGNAFEFATAPRIIFGVGRREELPALAAAMGRNALVVTGTHSHRAEKCLFSTDGLHLHYHAVSGEPTVEDVLAGVEAGRRLRCDLVIGFGGGGAIDAAKAIAALLTNGRDIHDYLEVIGKGESIANRPLPLIAVPTTAGTGAEATRNAVLRSASHRVKVSMRSPLMLPALALVDPGLTISLPPPVTAATGLDALTQLIEAFVSRRANPVTDSLCKEGIAAAARSLRTSVDEPDNLDARRDMSLASLLSGIALANAGLGAVHGFAGPIGGMFDAPHGAVCAALLPAVFAANVAGAEGTPVRPKFDAVGRMLTGGPDGTAADAVTWISDTRRALGIPSLSSFGIRETDIPDIVAKSRNTSSMKGNPIVLSDEVLTAVLRQSLS